MKQPLYFNMSIKQHLDERIGQFFPCVEEYGIPIFVMSVGSHLLADATLLEVPGVYYITPVLALFYLL